MGKITGPHLAQVSVLRSREKTLEIRHADIDDIDLRKSSDAGCSDKSRLLRIFWCYAHLQEVCIAFGWQRCSLLSVWHWAPIVHCLLFQEKKGVGLLGDPHLAIPTTTVSLLRATKSKWSPSEYPPIWGILSFIILHFFCHFFQCKQK